MKSTIPLTTPVLSASLTQGKIKLTWDAVDGASKYWIYRSTDGKTFAYYDATSKTTYTNSSVNSGTQYYYKVKAVKNVNGTNWVSDLSAGKAVKVLQAPVLSLSKSAGKIKLSWNAVDGAAKYWIYRSTDGKTFAYYDATSKTSYINSSVNSGIKYYYKVKAVDHNGGTGLDSATKSTIALSTPSVSAKLESGKVKLKWNSVTGASKYWIYRSTDGKTFTYYDATSKTTYTNSSVNSGTRYYYKVKAVKNVNGTNWVSDASGVVSVKK